VALVSRKAVGAEVEAACALWQRAEAARTGKMASAAEAGDFARAMPAAASKPGALLLVGLLDDRLVAAVYGVPLRGDRTKAQVSMLAVEPEFWGQGIGTQMLRALVGALKRQGCRQLRMNVDGANDRARALYERNGWRHLGETEQVADGDEPELIYRIDLGLPNA
jgi:ribosomal protein S18 acetylase RimI-like enzyme